MYVDGGGVGVLIWLEMGLREGPKRCELGQVWVGWAKLSFGRGFDKRRFARGNDRNESYRYAQLTPGSRIGVVPVPVESVCVGGWWVDLAVGSGAESCPL